jgi:long-chain acyl-CoA synthetase
MWDMPSRIVGALPDTGSLVLGRTLPSLLREAVEANPNPAAFHQLRGGEWASLSTQDVWEQSRQLALGLAGIGVARGDRVALFVHSDLTFVVPDMACLLLGAVDVPLYLTQSEAALRHILGETQCRVLFVSDAELLRQFAPLLAGSAVQQVILCEGDGAGAAELLPDGAELQLQAALIRQGSELLAEEPERAAALLDQAGPQDLATIIYTSGTTGVPKGVMLSHENITSNAIGAFTGLSDFRRGSDETVLSFLPLSHVFARTLQYGLMWYGSSVHYSDPDRVSVDFKTVRPTLFASVPRVLDKAYERILAVGAELGGVKGKLFDWALALARDYRIAEPPGGVAALQLQLADRLVLSKWRDALGGRTKNIIIGGAALRRELVDLFGAAGINVLQGYGLTESSPVITFNRPERNKAGTVGTAVPGVEITLSEEGEILTRGPLVMQGYYRNAEETARVIRNGWLHTGDLGIIDEEGFLSITGRKKDIFKLSTGKYVMPQPIEAQLEVEPLLEHVLVMGEGEKFCAAFLFLNPETLKSFAARHGLAGDMAQWLASGELRGHLTLVLERVNEGLDPWSSVRRAALLPAAATIENGQLTPTLKLRRPQILQRYEAEYAALYRGVAADGVSIIEGRAALAKA